MSISILQLFSKGNICMHASGVNQFTEERIVHLRVMLPK